MLQSSIADNEFSKYNVYPAHLKNTLKLLNCQVPKLK